jgi:MinD-like ATPase involved in chromosome partitioning or flagellar assembly
MAADYDRLFQPTEGMEIPEEATAQTGFDVSAPPQSPPMPPMPAGPPAANGHARPPMPVDRTEPAAPARPEFPSPPMPVEPAAPANGRARPPMPVDSTRRAPRPEPAPAQPAPQPQAPAPQQGRHARRAQSDPVDDGRTATPQRGRGANSHRANSQRGPGTEPTGRPVPAALPKPAAAQPFTKPPAAAKPVPQRGWRRGLHALTRINPGLSRDEKYELELLTRIRRTIRGSYEIGLVGLKGGAGKTSVTAALGSAFAQLRGDRILAVDADRAAGNLADRVGRQSAATIADVLANEALSHYNDIRAHTSMNAVNLEVLAAAQYRADRRRISDEEWQHAIAVMPRYFNLVLADCGSDLFDPATRGVLGTASGLVIVSSASPDGVRQAAVAIDWLRQSEYRALLSRACLVINHVAPGEANGAVNDLVRRIEQYVAPGRVVVLPWDRHIAAGTEIRLDLLGDTYRRRITELAAALSDDFDKG